MRLMCRWPDALMLGSQSSDIPGTNSAMMPHKLVNRVTTYGEL